MVAISQVMTINTENMNACNKFHGNESDSCWEISLQTKNVNVVVLETTGDPQIH